MTEKDFEFLESLKNEMLTQDTHFTADPRFWVVAERIKEYRPTGEGDYTDYVCIDLDIQTENLMDFVEYILDNYDKYDMFITDYETLLELREKDEFDYNDIEIILDILNALDIVVEVYHFDWVYKPSENHNTFFLTEKECKEHIEKNYYHYNQGIPYCVYGFRCYGLEQLINLITKTDWTKLREVYEAYRN